MSAVLMNMYYKMSALCKRFVYDEKGEVNIVAIVVLIGIAVALAIVFRKQIGNLLNNLFNAINKNANEAIQNGGT